MSEQTKEPDIVDRLELLERKGYGPGHFMGTCRDAAAEITRLRAERPGWREALEIVRGFLACPEIADCAPEDKDPETDALERRARALSHPSPPEGGKP